MGKKWQRVDPGNIKVGDRVKYVDLWRANGERRRDVARLTVTDVGAGYVNTWAAIADGRTWYVRRPKHPKLKATVWAEPLTRPDEPPVGTFFRVERTGETYWRHYPLSGDAYWHLVPFAECGVNPDWNRWDEITEPGDTITLLELVERDA